MAQSLIVDPISVNSSHLAIGDGRTDRWLISFGTIPMWFIWDTGVIVDHGYGWIRPSVDIIRLSFEVKETTINDIVD